MKKSQVKWAVKQALKETYGKSGFTSTADKFQKLLFKKLDKVLSKNKKP